MVRRNHGPVDREVVRPFEEAESDDVLARIVRVGDDEYHRESFTLDRAAEVLIYAIGEGDQSEMYDFARIEEAHTGHTVWAMSYPKADHAGGAQKNRLFEGILRLEAGDYRLVYQTDDSHSFGGWNSAKPNDQFSYGVTVFRR